MAKTIWYLLDQWACQLEWMECCDSASEFLFHEELADTARQELHFILWALLAA